MKPLQLDVCFAASLNRHLVVSRKRRLYIPFFSLSKLRFTTFNLFLFFSKCNSSCVYITSFPIYTCSCLFYWHLHRVAFFCCLFVFGPGKVAEELTLRPSIVSVRRARESRFEETRRLSLDPSPSDTRFCFFSTFRFPSDVASP